jgi:hypothetical protein
MRFALRPRISIAVTDIPVLATLMLPRTGMNLERVKMSITAALSGLWFSPPAPATSTR